MSEERFPLGRPVNPNAAVASPEWKPIDGRPYWFEHRTMKGEDGSPCKKYAPPMPGPKYTICPPNPPPKEDDDMDIVCVNGVWTVRPQRLTLMDTEFPLYLWSGM